ncbi:MAG: FAD-dependent thymidylate synthase [Parcubacteria group bacterium]|nr:FAD-dependent thymidylate synthase [Parcubacteria group bacterium]MCR4342473.1 FAD-dependent thymidylate synthase [Patescibacteria group bacterium]
MNIKLVSKSVIDPQVLASYAAKGCYEAEEPELGKKIDLQKRIFNVGHHTVLQHNHYTFHIEGIAVSDITFGLHLASPFYNSSQRSGRFCSAMFSSPDYGKIEQYIRTYWPEVGNGEVALALNLVKGGIEIFQSNIDKATKIAKHLIKGERPFASESYIEANAGKFAQEQMRMFVPTIFPTGITVTFNLSALVSMYRVAWSPVLKHVTSEMMRLALCDTPELNFMLEKEEQEEWPLELFARYHKATIPVLSKPKGKLVRIENANSFTEPKGGDSHPVDLLPFSPRYMSNTNGVIETEVEISVATMGQDQRHRTVKRGQPRFTERFYLPPIPRLCGLEGVAESFAFAWSSLLSLLPGSLVTALAPYGAMVSYPKRADFNAASHEYTKRLCWCTQEEIYHSVLSVRNEVSKKEGENSPLLKMFSPSCVKTGKCGEGSRYCGRDMKENCFIERKV